MISNENNSVLTVCQMLSNKCGDAALIIGRTEGLAGIFIDTDVTRRVVFANLEFTSSSVSRVMKLNHTIVSIDDSAVDALSTMVENRYRHFPVADSSSAVVGLLDIAKCLNGTISKLEHSQNKSGDATEDGVQQIALLQGTEGSQATILTQLPGLLMVQSFGHNASPILRNCLTRAPSTIVSPYSTVKKVCTLMVLVKKVALVVDNGELVNWLVFLDLET